MWRRRLVPSVRALAAHKLRAALAIASITIGVAAVVLTGAIGAGARADVLDRIERMGSNLLVVRPAQVPRRAARPTLRGVVTTLDVEDYEAIARLALVVAAAPVAEAQARIEPAGIAAAGTMRVRVLGTTPTYAATRRVRLHAGRFFDADDNDAARRVVVLGARVGETLYPRGDAVGQILRVRGVPFEIVGVLDARGVLPDGSDEDNQIFVPIRTALRRVLNVTWLSAVLVSVRDSAMMEQASGEIAALLRVRHRLARTGSPDDFAVQNTIGLLAIQQRAADALTQLVLGLSAIALMVGGIGILVLMLQSVKERTAEIGLRMAVGARPRDILVQFLAEATLLSLGGWTLGVALGALGAAFVRRETGWTIGLPLDGVAASLAMAAVVGLGFGAVPARKAARLPPIRALLSI